MKKEITNARTDSDDDSDYKSKLALGSYLVMDKKILIKS